MQYLFLGAAIVLEIIATTLLKASAGFTKLLPGLGCVIFYALCFYLFSRALLNIDLGVAYATWCAGGIVATTIISRVGIRPENQSDRHCLHYFDRRGLCAAEPVRVGGALRRVKDTRPGPELMFRPRPQNVFRQD